MTEIPIKYDMAKLEVQEALEFCIDSSGFQFPADSFRMRPKLDKEKIRQQDDENKLEQSEFWSGKMYLILSTNMRNNFLSRY